MATKRDYMLIATAIRRYAGRTNEAMTDPISRIVIDLSREFKKQNKNFNEELFIDSCLKWPNEFSGPND